MSATHHLLTQHLSDIEARMAAARAAAEAPFKAELRAVQMALAALEKDPPARGGAAPAHPAPRPAKPRSPRGRRRRTLGEMILMAMQTRRRGADIATIRACLEQRWNRSFAEAAVTRELGRLQHAGVVGRDNALWRLAQAPGPTLAEPTTLPPERRSFAPAPTLDLIWGGASELDAKSAKAS